MSEKQTIKAAPKLALNRIDGLKASIQTDCIFAVDVLPHVNFPSAPPSASGQQPTTAEKPKSK
jgi:hypothetical protein